MKGMEHTFNFNQLWPFTFTVWFHCITAATGVHRKHPATLPSLLFVMTHANYSRSLWCHSSLTSAPEPPPPPTHPTPHISISPSLVLSFTLFSMRLYFWARQCSYKHWTRTSMSLGGRCWCHDDDAESSLCFLSVSASLSCQCVWGREWLWEGIHQLPSSLHQTLCSKFVCPCICVCSFTSMGINWL